MTKIWFSADTHATEYLGCQPALWGLLDELHDDIEDGDAVVFAGDLAEADSKGLRHLFEEMEHWVYPMMFVAGNHDLWSKGSTPNSARTLLNKKIPEIAAEYGFQMLEQGPVILTTDKGKTVAIAGSYGGYDFSLADLSKLRPLQTIEVTQGWVKGQCEGIKWLDYKYMFEDDQKTMTDHAKLCVECCQKLQKQVKELEQNDSVDEIVVVTHTAGHVQQIKDHPESGDMPEHLKQWFAGISGSEQIGKIVRNSKKTKLHVCGHSHAPRFYEYEDVKWVNVGCTYKWKRWIRYDPDRETLEFGRWHHEKS